MDNVCLKNISSIGLCINFNEDHIIDLYTLITDFCNEHNINLRNIELCFIYPCFNALQNMAQPKLLDNYKFLISLSNRFINFQSSFYYESRDDYQNLLNYIKYKKGILIFIGNQLGYSKELHEAVIESQCVSYVELTNDIKTRKIWIGEMDNPNQPKFGLD